MPNELLSTSFPSNIEGGVDGSRRNGCIAHIGAHLQHFPLLCNNTHDHCVNPVQYVLHSRVSKKKGKRVCVRPPN